MGRKFLLTKEFVDAQSSPQKGELWFPDTEVRGFGLRLWAGPTGGGQAYCLRAKDAAGRWTRRQFKPWRDADPLISWLLNEPQSHDTLGEWLEQAREWARTEVCHLAGLPTEQERAEMEYSARRQHMDAVPFGDVLRRFLTKDRGAGFEDGYRDLMTTSIDAFLPTQLQEMPLGAVSVEQLIDALIQPGRSHSTVIAFRAFIAKVVTSDLTEGAGRQLRSKEGSDEFWQRAKEVWGVQAQTESEWLEELIKPLFDLLDQHPIDCVHAAFLRVYLLTGIKQKPLMQARWPQILNGYLYPYLPGSRSSWFWAREKMSPELEEFLERYRRAIEPRLAQSDLIFPSFEREPAQPITSVQRYWRGLCKDLQLGPAAPSLAQFAAKVMRRSQPSLFMSQSNNIYLMLVTLRSSQIFVAEQELSKLETRLALSP